MPKSMAMYELIITEKPAAAAKIADALADGKSIRENNQGVPYYKITHGKNDIVVACAVGHLFGLAEKDKSGWKYPVFDIEWKPSSEMSKGSAFTKKYFNTIKKLAKSAREVTVACDYDQEGEVIGLNVVRYLCNKKDANRMKFSTLTKDELRESYETKHKTLDWGQAIAGETRHFLDWYNGINYSRALTASIRSTGAFKIMSTGRVQGPALKIIVDREKEIRKFVSKPFWQIELHGEFQHHKVLALHKEDKFWDKEKADNVFAKTRSQKTASVDRIEKKQFNQLAPYPFDLTSMQVESYRCFGINPKETLEIAQELYTAGFISYPRTSSQQLPPSIGYEKVLKDLSRNDDYSSLAPKILKKGKLNPNNGKKTDPAHPAIFPTGIIAKGLDAKARKVYDLIVKRFISTFAEHAVRETVTAGLNCNEEIFITKGTRTLEKGWHEFYAPYVNLEEVELPHFKEKDNVNVNKVEILSKETQPPKRYTQASIIKELERRNLGTKATRSEIVDTLFRRGYVDGRSIEATELGILTIETLEKFAPKIIDEELTRHFELEMDKIRENPKMQDKILDEAKDAITKILHEFKDNIKDIGKDLHKAHKETQDEMTNLGECPICKVGSITIRRGKFGIFASCNKYPDCKTIFSLPKNALLKPAKKMCEQCSYPMVLAIKKGKQPMELCLNQKCPSKHVEGQAGDDAKAIESGEVKRKCPKCSEGDIVLRSSIYGKFYGCSKYPKCRFTERIVNNKSEEE